ncbi:MAG: acylneuraminate cytidylyltransferase family protein [Bacteroidales bacterium]|nr:acylneuraminate cytidylyltransferase family protein [Bacteroidales bacterium]
MVNTRAIAVIPARGGSKRLPRKNILPFGGRPMIAWTIDAALRSGLFDTVLVSTEDAEIAEIARAEGAEVPFLRTAFYDDTTPISAATILAVDQMRSWSNRNHDLVVQLMANCPLRGSDEIIRAITAFQASKADFQISCTRFGWLNPWWALQLDANGAGSWAFPDAARSRSQDLPPLYVPTGAIWIAHAGPLVAAGTFYGPGHRFEPMPWQSAVDIDDAEDLAFAETALRLRTAS